MRQIYIMDTTLRDGEQTSGVSFSEDEKLTISKALLTSLKVDYIEIASARVSEGEFNGAKRVLDWASGRGFLNQVEILGFIDGGVSIDWIERAGGKVINMLTKGSFKHLKYQLKKSKEQHVADIKRDVAIATSRGIKVNVYLEDWSNGVKDSPEYVMYLLNELQAMDINRVMLPDTLGILYPSDTYSYCKLMVDSFPEIKFDFHAHNDYDLAIANVGEAIRAGISTVHTTVNGLGERAGNAPLSSVVALVNDHFDFKLNIEERKINTISKLVESLSAIRIPHNKPIIGESVFTQCSGVHADGDNKNNLYYNDLLPERFGRSRKYALGKTSGKANVLKNLEDLDIYLDSDDLKRVTSRVIELGDSKESITVEDLPYIISDVLKEGSVEESIKLINFSISTTKGLKPIAILAIDIDGKRYEDSCSGAGQYNSFMNALRKIYSTLNKPFPMLTDYSVTIPPGGHTDALVETVITWGLGREFKTRGLDTDQTVAAIKATIKMLNIIEKEYSY